MARGGVTHWDTRSNWTKASNRSTLIGGLAVRLMPTAVLALDTAPSGTPQTIRLAASASADSGVEEDSCGG